MDEPVYQLPPAMLSMQSYDPNCIPELYHAARKQLDVSALEHRFGRGLKVAVIDSGIETSHPEFEDRLLDAVDMTDSKIGPEDAIGHGTHVSGTIVGNAVGLARSAKVLSIKIIDDQNVGRHDAVCRGFEHALDKKVDIVNISMGSPQNSPRLMELTQACRDAGILIVAASGNDANTRLLFPAALDTTLAVGAIDRQDQWMSFSNYDENDMAVDLVDYGDNIISSYLKGTYHGMTGTSMAAPQVTACVMLRMAAEYARSVKKRWDLRAKYSMLEKACKPVSNMIGRTAKCGWGQLDMTKLFGGERLPDDFVPLATSDSAAVEEEDILTVRRRVIDNVFIVRARGVELFKVQGTEVTEKK